MILPMPVVGSKVFCGLITSVDLKKVLFALGISLSSLLVFRNSCPDADGGAVQYDSYPVGQCLGLILWPKRLNLLRRWDVACSVMTPKASSLQAVATWVGDAESGRIRLFRGTY
jgi:hypothetical protein